MMQVRPTELRVNGELIEIDSLPALQNIIKKSRTESFAEIWIKGDKEDSLAVLFNNDRAMLVYLRYPGDAGLTSLNSETDVAHDEMVEFILGGASEKFPAGFVVTADLAVRAAEDFFTARIAPSSINWHDNGGFLI